MKSKKKSLSAIAKAIDEAVFEKVAAAEEVPEDNEETQAKIVDTIEEEGDDDIFDQDFSKEKPSKLRILNASRLDTDQKYQGKKITRKSLQSFGIDSDNEALDSDSEDSDDEADDDEEHAGAELGHMFEMDGVDYDDEDDPGLRNKRSDFAGSDLEEAYLSNTSDNVGSEVDAEESHAEEDEDKRDNEYEGDSEEDEDVERIKSMILKSKVEKGDPNANDEDTDENSAESETDSNTNESDNEMGFDLSAAAGFQSKTDNGNEEEADFDTFKPMNVENETSKGNAIKAQLKLWDSLLELRIALQKSLVKVNQLPPAQHWHIFKSGGSEVDSNNDTIKNCQKNLAKVLDSIIGLRDHINVNR